MRSGALLEQFNRMGSARKSLIRKALDSATGTGEALIPEKLEEIITNTIVRLTPEMALVTPRYDAQKFHEFNRITALPAAGGAMGEGATTPTRNSTYQRDTVELKVIRRKGAVTNFLQDSSQNYIDAAAAEMENHLVAHVYDLIAYSLWGNQDADQYSYDGIEQMISTNRTNEASGGSVPSDLSFLDDMIDLNVEANGAMHRKAFLMSPKMQSKVSRLLTNVRLQQGGQDGLAQVEIRGGWRLAAYRNIPIIPSSAVRPKGTMGAITVTDAGAGGAITNDEYFFMVAPVTYNGEELASAENSVTTVGSDTITVSWSAYTGALYYKIYCGLTTGGSNLALVKVIPAFTYDASGTITGDRTDVTFSSDPDSTDPTTSTGETNTVPAHMASDVPLVATGGVAPENVILWDLDEYQGLGKMPYTNSAGSRFGGLVTIKPLAETDDFLPFLVKSYAALCPSFEQTSVIHRGLRVD